MRSMYIFLFFIFLGGMFFPLSSMKRSWEQSNDAYRRCVTIPTVIRENNFSNVNRDLLEVISKEIELVPFGNGGEIIKPIPLRCAFPFTPKNNIVIREENVKTNEEKTEEDVKKYKYTCDICPFKTGHKARLNVHIKLHTKPAFKCEKCWFLASKRRVFDDHKETHESSIIKYECLVPGCGIHTTTRRKIETHWHNKHSKRDKSDITSEERYKKLKI